MRSGGPSTPERVASGIITLTVGFKLIRESGAVIKSTEHCPTTNWNYGVKYSTPPPQKKGLINYSTVSTVIFCFFLFKGDPPEKVAVFHLASLQNSPTGATFKKRLPYFTYRWADCREATRPLRRSKPNKTPGPRSRNSNSALDKARRGVLVFWELSPKKWPWGVLSPLPSALVSFF